jgi:MFS transporter, putative metabolite:H+ symporter
LCSDVKNARSVRPAAPGMALGPLRSALAGNLLKAHLPPQAQCTMSATGERVTCLPLTSLHLGAAVLCALGFGIDLMEISVSNALSAVFSTPPNALSSIALSWLLASVYLGAVIGAPLVGRIADRHGMQSVLTWTLLWLGLTSLLAAARPDPLWFGCFRLLSGVALGSYPPLMVAYLTAITPDRHRGLVLFWVCGLAYLTPPFAVFLIRWLTPIRPLGIDGWRWPFLLSGLAALVGGVAFKHLPESPRWLAAMGHKDRARKSTLAFECARPLTLFGRTIPRIQTGHEAQVLENVEAGGRGGWFSASFPFVAALYFLHPWAMGAFPLLTGPMLLSRGYSLSKTLLYVAVATFGPAASAFTAGLFIDRIPRRSSLIACCVLLLAALTVFFVTTGSWLLMLSVILFAAGVAIYTPIMTMYGAELTPITVRASATTVAWAGNRLAAMLVPLVILPLFAKVGSTAVAVETGAVLLGTIALIAFAGPRVKTVTPHHQR